MKAKLLKEQKITSDNIKKLSGDRQKEELEDHLKKLTEEAKFFKDKLKGLEEG